MSFAKRQRKAKVSRYACPVEGCEVSVYVTYDDEDGYGTVTDFGCSRQGECGIPSYDPCPFYTELIERHGIRRFS